MAALSLAADRGARMIEMDATVSADGVAVVHHDFELDRCTNGTGPIIQHTYEQLQALDCGAWFDKKYPDAPVKFAGEPLPTLAQAARLILDRSMALNLEIKPSLGWDEPTARVCAETLAQVWPADAPIVVSSMSERALGVFKAHAPQFPRGLITYAIPENWRERMTDLGCVSLHCSHFFATPGTISEVQDAGYKILAYTVNDTAEAKRLFDDGLDAVFTDRIGEMNPLYGAAAPA
ncbi:glycerophosphodiester phosphodiesterase family protein [Varunaivibrio sulfuroxidans]|uniref:glycerophosphodiester phosphodiesterase family protein n=1 Tax=Varunaivibrio sulfuroxidans TaxID=1773489 RepID=UPI0023E0B5A2|nr:glycerophosphodiester phosphodiesterase family protein [Varunaivibrio sulfuroxidans]WES30415.1 glycerophosphodiester phosphodiesterase family protein [Varunaivibrio sulfuroxidans]